MPFRVRSAACRSLLLAGALGAVLASAPASAATQGLLGATSTGTVTITASVANRVQITGLNDVTFTNVDPGTAASVPQNNCVWSNTLTRGYSILATGSGTTNAFTLANAATPALTVPYSVQWSATSGSTTGSAVTAGTALTGLTSSAITPTCSINPATTSSLIVSISAPNLQSMTAGASYTGTLTLLVSPQ